MSNYSYVAVDPQGAETRGTLDVPDQSEALRRIREMGLFPTKVLGAAEAKLRTARTPPRHRARSLAIPSRGSMAESRAPTLPFSRVSLRRWSKRACPCSAA